MINEYMTKQYCCDDISLIENYDIAINSIERYCCHHKNEILLNKSHAELKELDLYYNRPSTELVFLTLADHLRLHWKHNKTEHASKISKAHTGLTYTKTDEYRKKMSESVSGEKNGMYGKTHSLETRKKMSDARKGKHTSLKGKHWKLVDGKRVYY